MNKKQRSSKKVGSPKITESQTIDSQPTDLKVEHIEITLEVETGNLIYGRFDNFESAIEFVNHYTNNPAAILEKITPKKRVPQKTDSLPEK